MNVIPMYQWVKDHRTGERKNDLQCPFGVRDLSSDECYSGSGRNRCKFFVRYDWEKFYGCIICNHTKEETKLQLELF